MRFAGAIVPASEDVYPGSVAAVHNDGPHVCICAPGALFTSERFFAEKILLFVFQYLDPPNLFPLTGKQVSMLIPSAEYGGAL